MATIRRLPIVLIVGSDDHLKLNLAVLWRDEFAAQAKSWALLVNTEHSAKDATHIPACLCCTGKPTLFTKLTQLLRSQRQNPAFEGIILVANSKADILVTLDQLGQPLLQSLLWVSNVVYCVQDGQRFEPELALNSDMVIGKAPSAAMDTSSGIRQASHFSRQHFVDFFDCSALKNLAQIGSFSEQFSRESLFRWPVDKLFNRTQLETIFNNQARALGPFDAVFRTQREWYRWTYEEQTLSKTVASFRRESYLSLVHAQEPQLLLPLLDSISAQIMG
jgi:hypothetical protein